MCRSNCPSLETQTGPLLEEPKLPDPVLFQFEIQGGLFDDGESKYSGRIRRLAVPVKAEKQKIVVDFRRPTLLRKCTGSFAFDDSGDTLCNVLAFAGYDVVRPGYW
jgi:hypothetical protein